MCCGALFTSRSKDSHTTSHERDVLDCVTEYLHHKPVMTIHYSTSPITWTHVASVPSGVHSSNWEREIFPLVAKSNHLYLCFSVCHSGCRPRQWLWLHGKTIVNTLFYYCLFQTTPLNVNHVGPHLIAHSNTVFTPPRLGCALQRPLNVVFTSQNCAFVSTTQWPVVKTDEVWRGRRSKSSYQRW